ncbi:NnrU family protein [Bosea vestrisii]|uniref:NnrU family protein n=1 Tax=Bosea vestrisii TaxID=151416 RepID=A0ABW0HHP0_9HYPH
MQQLAFAAAAFFMLHRLISASRLRGVLVRQVGEATFRRLFQAASLFCLVWLIAGYRLALNWPGNRPLFDPAEFVRWIQWPLQYCALLLVIAGFTARNPATAGMQDAVHEDVIHGVLRITRHPFLWGVALMSAGHMLALPDLASWAFFGTLLFLAFTGTFSIDAKRRAALGTSWARFASETSNLPFKAILQRRQRLSLREIGWRLPLLTLAAFALVIGAHVLVWKLVAH